MTAYLRGIFRQPLVRTVIINYATKLWTMCSGLVSIWFVAHNTSPAQQGLYYTINSLLALQIFVELGFNYAVVRVIGHRLGFATSERVIDRPLQLISQSPQLEHLIAKFCRQSLFISGTAFLIIGPIGIWYFSRLPGDTVAWTLWLPLVGVASINISINTLLSIVEGLGATTQVALVRLLQATTLGITLWIALEMHAGLVSLLWSNAFSTAVIIGISFKAFFPVAQKFFKKVPLRPDEQESRALKVYMRKIALSGVSGYLIFQIFTPIITMYSGPVEAGKFAMTLQIITSLNIFGLVPLTSSAPRLGQLIGSRNIAGAYALFKKIALSSSVMLIAASTILAGLLWMLGRWNAEITTRVLPLGLFSLMLLAAIANHLVFSIASYLRSFLDDPFWILSLFSAVVGSVGAYIGIRSLGSEGAVFTYFINCTVVGLTGAWLIMRKETRKLNEAVF